MTRRNFLQALATFLAALAGGGWAQAKARPPTATPLLLVQRSALAGFQFYHGEEVWPKIQLGDELRLLRNAGNPHDARAVEVYWQGWKLGYVPRLDNAAVSQMLDRGEAVTAKVAALQTSRNPWKRLQFDVYWRAPV